MDTEQSGNSEAKPQEADEAAKSARRREEGAKRIDLEEQFALLSKKVDEQFKFTRTVVVLCTLVTIGLIIFTILLTFESLPAQILLHCMSNMEPIVKQWKQVEASFDTQRNRNQ